jgi:hypothetical protein
LDGPAGAKVDPACGGSSAAGMSLLKSRGKHRDGASRTQATNRLIVDFKPCDWHRIVTKFTKRAKLTKLSTPRCQV